MFRLRYKTIANRSYSLLGDWIELTVLTEISDDKDESLRDKIIEIQNIKARNSRIYCGEITHLRDGLGIINSEVHFREDVCEPGYIPSINDMVRL